MLYNGHTAFAFCVLVLCSARFPSVDAAAYRANGYEGVYDPGRAAGWQVRWLLLLAAAYVSMSPSAWPREHGPECLQKTQRLAPTATLLCVCAVAVSLCICTVLEHLSRLFSFRSCPTWRSPPE